MKLFAKGYDGGEGSGVTGYFLIELKPLFSVVLLHFANGTREAYHEHAFNALTLWLKGRVRERKLWGGVKEFRAGQWKYTPRKTFHKVEALGSAWALSVRGPWVDFWREWRADHFVMLTHGRVEVWPTE